MVAMARQLRTEIHQTKPFASLEEEVFLNLHRTADALLHGLEAALKPVGLSASQYNVLRILRGAEAEGLACREVAERMVTRIQISPGYSTGLRPEAWSSGRATERTAG